MKALPLPSIDDVDPLNAERDAKASMSFGDYRFAGIWSISLYAPGIPKELTKKYGVKGIGDTGCIRTGREAKYEKARSYVDAYNAIILKAVEK